MVGKVEKLLRKIDRKDRMRLLSIIKELITGRRKNLNIKKIKDTDFYRLKQGRFRIIFHYENGETVVDSIKLRDEKTYRKL